MVNPICIALGALALVLLLGYIVAAQKFFSRFKLAQVPKEKTITTREWQIQPRTGSFSLVPFVVLAIVIILAIAGVLWALDMVNIELG